MGSTSWNEQHCACADGTGPALYAGDDFTLAGGMPANFIAKWNGQQWSALDGGMNNGVNVLTGDETLYNSWRGVRLVD